MKTKRIILSALYIFLAFAFFTACSGETASAPLFIDDGTADALDYGGYNFIFAGHYREGAMEVNPETGDSDQGDKLLARYNDIEKAYNITISFVETGNDIVEKITPSIAIGKKFADMVDTQYDYLSTLYKGGMLTPVNSIIDETTLLSGKYGSQNQIESVTMHKKDGDDEIWAFYPAYWGIPYPKFSNLCYFNNDLVSRNNLDNPFELKETGKWNWTNFEQLCLQVENNGSDPNDESDDTYGVAEDGRFNYIMKGALLSNGVQAVYYDDNLGKYVCGLDTPQTLEAMNWVRNLCVEGALRVKTGSGANETIGLLVEDFSRGKSLFMIEYSYHGITDSSSLAYTSDVSYSFISFPTGPSSTDSEGKGAISFLDRMFGFPYYSENEDQLKSIIPALLEPLGDQKDYDWRENTAKYIFYNDNSRDNFFEMFDNAIYDYSKVLETFFEYNYLVQITDGTKTPQELLSSYLKVAESEIDRNLNSLTD